MYKFTICIVFVLYWFCAKKNDLTNMNKSYKSTVKIVCVRICVKQNHFTYSCYLSV